MTDHPSRPWDSSENADGLKVHSLVDRETDRWWSERAQKVIEGERAAFAFVGDDGTALVSESGRTQWFTFAGGRANVLLAAMLQKELGEMDEILPHPPSPRLRTTS